MPSFTVYVLKSLKDGKRYTGFSSNLKLRLRDHEDGLVKSTRARRPLTLIHFEIFSDKKAAMKREKFFKTGQGREFLNTL